MTNLVLSMRRVPRVAIGSEASCYRRLDHPASLLLRAVAKEGEHARACERYVRNGPGLGPGHGERRSIRKTQAFLEGSMRAPTSVVRRIVTASAISINEHEHCIKLRWKQRALKSDCRRSPMQLHGGRIQMLGMRLDLLRNCVLRAAAYL